MKPLWNRYADRFSALSQRERLLAMLAVLAAILLVGYMSVIEPQLSRQKIARQMLAQQQIDLNNVQAQLASAQAKAQDPDVDNRASLQRTRQQATALDQRLKAIERTMMAPDKVAGLLDAFLQRDRRLQLISLRNLPVVDLMERKETVAKSGLDEATARAKKVPQRLLGKDGVDDDMAAIKGTLYKHGVELTVSGSYADLTAYLAALEEMPQQVFWGSVKLAVEEYPRARMTLTVYTLSLDEAWLTL